MGKEQLKIVALTHILGISLKEYTYCANVQGDSVIEP